MINEVTFISVDYLKERVQVNDNVPDKNVLRHIIEVQDLEVEPILGTDLYEACKTRISSGTLTGNYATLINKYVANALIYGVYEKLITSASFKLANGNVYRSETTNSTAVTVRELGYMKNDVNEHYEAYKERLVNYLCENSSLFPEYSTNTGADISPQPSGLFNGISVDNTDYGYAKILGQRITDGS